MELEQCCRLEQDGNLRDALGEYEQRSQTKQGPIQRTEIRGPLPATLADEQLMFKNDTFRGYSAHSAGAQKFQLRSTRRAKRSATSPA